MRSFTLIPLLAIGGALAQSSTTTTEDSFLSSITSSLASAATGLFDDSTTSSSSTTRSRTSLFSGTNATTTSNPANPTLSIYGLNNLANTYAASVVQANVAATTYDVICSRGNFLCPSGIAFQMTQAPTSLQLRNTATTLGVTITESYSCKIEGTTSASCIYSVKGQGKGASTSTSLETTYSQSLLPYATVVVTAGQEKLAAASTVPAPEGSASGSQGAGARGVQTPGVAGVGGLLMVAMGLVGVLAVVL
ncbi:hypothetical protein BDZ85DRAFT_3342 [Elsinoe ampelina]|uniref:Uncharacterized protein n=1 Tax=Elsinoe ampelina TaxID=302913 RepID=A0A6A6GP89_9PEZI|nr:hypothetical protein BDZ85DRAFT_3342 [Elsinoe ampelina]